MEEVNKRKKQTEITTFYPRTVNTTDTNFTKEETKLLGKGFYRNPGLYHKEYKKNIGFFY